MTQEQDIQLETELVQVWGDSPPLHRIVGGKYDGIYFVECPICEELTPVHVDFWHTWPCWRDVEIFSESELIQLDAAARSREELAIEWRQKTIAFSREQNAKMWQEEGNITWIPSKNGGFHGFYGPYVLILKERASGYWSNGGYLREEENGKAIISWRKNFPTLEAAKKNAELRASKLVE